MAADQITFQTQKTSLKERSRLLLSVNFRNRDTASAVVPTNIRYRVDCLATGAEVTGWTSVSPASNVTITIAPTRNTIQSSRNKRERKQLTVASDYGLDTQCTESFEYELINLRGVS